MIRKTPMTKSHDNDVVPRISVLEKTQEAISKDLLNLSHSVKSQGEQLTAAILSLSQTQNVNYNALTEKIGSSKQTDWPTLIGAMSLCILIIGGLMTHIYVQFSYVDKEQLHLREDINRMNVHIEESIKEQSALKTHLEHINER